MKKNAKNSIVAIVITAVALVASGCVFTGCMNPVPRNSLTATLPNGAKIGFETRKNTSAEGIEYSHNSASTNGVTNVFTLKVQKLSSTNDPQVIDKSYAGQAVVEKERWNGINTTLEKLSNLKTEAAKTVVGVP